ncbi:sortilin-related receptor-like [Hyposmocoma kahamanoa]|uniref:sortilin-related receptor-like n=1 Tax=Hyposmocoma kahamanoa TaxID=1477025 RepID=UPI000E6D9FCB|nr:sortilin-related receptor-like [Hyposmocoma kahamanoa]
MDCQNRIVIWAEHVDVSVQSKIYAPFQETGDLYWEGEDDPANEYLEVKEEESSAGGRFRRLKRFLGLDDDPFSLFGSPESSTTPEPYDSVTEDQLSADEDTSQDNDDLDNFGSGVPDRDDTEPVEKTLRVTFVVNQPYSSEYSNRDSPQFQNFSRSLADAVNVLFESLPGIQRASLVRIQSRISDEFTCKVTLDIVTSGYDNTTKISTILKTHIIEKRTLGEIVVSESDYSATVIDPSLIVPIVECKVNELQCNDGGCVSGSARCNGNSDCADGSDEAGCLGNMNTTQSVNSGLTNTQRPEVLQTPLPLEPTSYLDTDRGDQNGLGLYTNEDTTPIYDVQSYICYDNEFLCDSTRCVSLSKRCDGNNDCYDGTDEKICNIDSNGKICGDDDFRCNNGMCIEGSRRCDRIVDCSDREDEENCECNDDEFRCLSDGSCIEMRKRCDNISHCADSSDEIGCASEQFRCRSGKLIHQSLRCNRQYDCPRGDYSDEQNCQCAVNDFTCDNGFCIPASKLCDRTNDCQDSSDERNCSYGNVCMANQHMCYNGQCVLAEAKCNGTTECLDFSDELNCPCRRDEFTCQDGTCINIALRCNGERNCPSGEDELNCGVQRCPPDTFTCPADSSVPCAKKCNSLPECSGGEDEEDCDKCNHECDGRCLQDSQICNGVPDCSDSSDELQCADCEGPEDFRCRSGECINIINRCNQLQECLDNSDEEDCNNTMTPPPYGCIENQFQCRSDGACINDQFVCDGNADCHDNSDEEDCQCDKDQWKCKSGQCIPVSAYCNDYFDCEDNSDEQNCPTSPPYFTTTYSPYRPAYPPVTTQAPFYNNVVTPYPQPGIGDRCSSNEWRCENGPCISTNLRCNGQIDCPFDMSDEFDCPAGSKNML